MTGIKLKAAATNVEDFMLWARMSRFGDWCIYHTGRLALDRSKRPELDELAELVHVLHDCRFVNNTQSRAPGDRYTYMATRTGQGYIPAAVLNHDVTAGEYRAMRVIRDGEASMSAVRALRLRLGVSDIAAENIIQNLKSRGLVQHDGYSEGWNLSDSGRKLVI